MKNAIVLCSGGMDSVVAAHGVKEKYDKIVFLFFDYGQRAIEKERESATRCASEIGAELIEMRLSELGKFSGSLINKEGEVKELSKEDLKDTSEEGEKWYVPCRNVLFLSYALALAESKFDECDLIVGFKCEGKESYPDTTKEFVSRINDLALSCNGKFKVVAPLHDLDKEDIVKLGLEKKVVLEKTWSCYSPLEGKQCGKCLACALRREGFRWAEEEDKTDYFKS